MDQLSLINKPKQYYLQKKHKFNLFKKDLKLVFNTLYTFIIRKLNYLILEEHAQILENIADKINNLELTDLIEVIDKLNLSEHEMNQHTFFIICLNLLNIDINPIKDFLPIDNIYNKKLLIENQEGGDYYGCVIPDLTEDSLKKMKTRDRAKICKQNQGYPKNTYKSRTGCQEAIYQNPTLCHPPTSSQSLNLQKNIYQNLPYDIFPYQTYQETKNAATQFYQSTPPILKGNAIIQFINIFFKYPRFQLISILLLFLFSLLFFNLILPLRTKEHLRRKDIERREREREKIEMDRVMRENMERRRELVRQRREVQEKQRRIRFKINRTIKKVIYYIGFIEYTRSITHSKIREQLHLEKKNLIGVEVIVLGDINRRGTIIGKTKPKFKTSKDIVQFDDSTQMKLFLGKTRKRKSYLKTKMGKDFRFIYETLQPRRSIL